MKNKANNLIMRNAVFAWIAAGVGCLLLLPLIAMQFTTEVNWETADFIVMGILIFSISSLFVLVARKVPSKYWLVWAVLCAVTLFYVWAELAVGIFTNLGS
ncbi:hypothetical protein [Idiomarina sp. HP20-50]|uniref:hypothetical protein n=1 Tax=Idiomarina sp. HP20-50 TaxID=3070813 RepID=UPI00294B0EA5|nr:hypothetical protein [Idiomarina sp. HP20-50]MDV6317268.1 hypothetical protein [Idiomarina sp. HP20-50]